MQFAPEDVQTHGAVYKSVAGVGCSAEQNS